MTLRYVRGTISLLIMSLRISNSLSEQTTGITIFVVNTNNVVTGTHCNARIVGILFSDHSRRFSGNILHNVYSAQHAT